MASNLYSALLEFQKEMTTVVKDGKANYGKYVTLPNVIEQVQPVLNRHGLLITQFPAQTIDGQPGLRTILAHPESGETIEDISPLTLAKQDPQAQGSALTYMRRYGYAAVTQIVIDEDDDGQRASTPSSSGTPGKASVKQINFAQQLIDKSDKDATRAWYKTQFGSKKLGDLTSREASQLIEHLNGKPAGTVDDVAEYSDEIF